MAFLKWFTGRK